MTTTSDTFETRLAAELSAAVAANPAPTHATQPARRRRRLVLGGSAAAAVTAAIVLLQGGASPAFAVDRSSDGSVTVTIERAEDAAGLQKALRAKGVNAYVDYLPDGKACALGRFTPANAGGRSTISIRRDAAGLTFSITSSQLRPGVALVVEGAGGDLSTTRIGFAQGDVGACTPVDASTVPGPLAPAPGTGSGSSSDDGSGVSTHREEIQPSPAGQSSSRRQSR